MGVGARTQSFRRVSWYSARSPGLGLGLGFGVGVSGSHEDRRVVQGWVGPCPCFPSLWKCGGRFEAPKSRSVHGKWDGQDLISSAHP